VKFYTKHKLLIYLLAGTLLWQPVCAQDSTRVVSSTIPDSVKTLSSASLSCCGDPWHMDSAAMLKSSFKNWFKQDPKYYLLDDKEKRKRIWIIASANAVGYGAVMIGLYNSWYKDYPQTKFHFFDDSKEWQQVDKVGHLYSAYIESRASMELWRWTGIERKKRIWIGGMSGAFYQTVIEILDGFSGGWGWSWSDFSANIIGSSALVSQELAWNEQRIKLKFSFHRKNYQDPELNQRSDNLFGESWAERMIKDYNGQTYWASANLKSFFPKSNLPPWFSVALGYGAEGMFGGMDNTGRDKDGNITFDRRDIKRYRQWYLAPDVDLTKIKTNKKAVKFALTVLSAFKFPTPAIALSNGKLKARAIVF